MYADRCHLPHHTNGRYEFVEKGLKRGFPKTNQALGKYDFNRCFQPCERLVELNLAKDLEVSRFWIWDAFKFWKPKV
jgi:hypothetical protein